VDLESLYRTKKGRVKNGQENEFGWNAVHERITKKRLPSGKEKIISSYKLFPRKKKSQ